MAAAVCHDFQGQPLSGEVGATARAVEALGRVHASGGIAFLVHDARRTMQRIGFLSA